MVQLLGEDDQLLDLLDGEGEPGANIGVERLLLLKVYGRV
jgi:hypothetical protein